MSSRQQESSCLPAVVMLVMVIPMMIWNGIVLSILWNWFVPEIFSMLPSISPGQAMGLSLVFAVWTYSSSRSDVMPSDHTASEIVASALTTYILNGLLFLLFGWVLQAIIF